MSPRYPDVPEVGVYIDGFHRYWHDGTGPFPSVTSITGVIGKTWLADWAVGLVAASAVSHFEDIRTHMDLHLEPDGACFICLVAQNEWPEWGPDARARAAQTWLAAQGNKKRDDAANLGSRVHALAEAAAYGVEPEMTDEERPFYEAYKRWHAEYRVEEIEAEAKVISKRHWYAGTVDLIARVNGYVTLIDYKTGSTIPDDIELQLVGYGRADGIAREGVSGLTPMPRIERYAVLHLRPEKYPKAGGYRFEYRPVLPRTFELFLDARRLYEWKQEADRKWRRQRAEKVAA